MQYAIYNSELTSAPQVEGFEFIALKDMEYEAVRANGEKLTRRDGTPIMNSALTITHAAWAGPEQINVRFHLHLGQLFGMQYEDGRAKHARKTIAITPDVVSAEAWVQLKAYAKFCEGKEVRNGDLVLASGGQGYHLTIGLTDAEACFIFELEQRPNAVIDGVEYEVYTLENVELYGVQFVSPISQREVGDVVKGRNPLANATSSSRVNVAPIARPAQIPARLTR
jgi:hypothetical protein